MSIEITAILAGTIAAATPLIFAGLGELVAERTGVINLGVEGMMLVGALAGFAFAAQYEASVATALLVGAGAGSRQPGPDGLVSPGLVRAAAARPDPRRATCARTGASAGRRAS